jgi:hypothetical protein
VAAFPEGQMSSGQIFREGAFLTHFSSFISLIVENQVSAKKKKLEKEAMEQEIDE